MDEFADRVLAEVKRRKQDALAEADGTLNDVALPNTYALARELKAMIALAAASDDPASNRSIEHARLTLSRIEPYLPAGI